MDDVDFSNIIKHILCPLDLFNGITVSRFKYSSPISYNVYLYREDYLDPISRKWIGDMGWVSDYIKCSIYKERIQKRLTEHGVAFNYVAVDAQLWQTDRNERDDTPVAISITIENPYIDIPEPETEGGYETWMM